MKKKVVKSWNSKFAKFSGENRTNQGIQLFSAFYKPHYTGDRTNRGTFWALYHLFFDLETIGVN